MITLVTAVRKAKTVVLLVASYSRWHVRGTARSTVCSNQRPLIAAMSNPTSVYGKRRVS